MRRLISVVKRTAFVMVMFNRLVGLIGVLYEQG